MGSVAEAQAAAAAGVDAVVAQGIEAGGHVRGTTSIWKLLPATVAALGELQGCSVVNDLKPAATIVRDLVRDAEAAMAGS